MPKFEVRRRVPHSARQMYDLVADMERYPDFLPLCEGLRIRSRTESGSTAVVVADMDVGYGAIRERFTSRVELDPSGLTIRSANVNGPFKRMDNTWTFVDVAPQDGGMSRCDVIFFIDYDFKSTVLQLLMGAMFDRAFRRFAQAFEERAKVVYGRT